MASVTINRHVAAPLERVFATFTDLERAPQTIDAITELELLSHGEVGVGTRWRETRVMFGKQATEEMAITEFEPNRSYAVEADSHGTRYRTVFTFEPRQGGTDVTMTFGAEPYTLGAKLMSPLGKLMMRTVEKECARDMDCLAAEAERG